MNSHAALSPLQNKACCALRDLRSIQFGSCLACRSRSSFTRIFLPDLQVFRGSSEGSPPCAWFDSGMLQHRISQLFKWAVVWWDAQNKRTTSTRDHPTGRGLVGGWFPGSLPSGGNLRLSHYCLFLCIFFSFFRVGYYIQLEAYFGRNGSSRNTCRSELFVAGHRFDVVFWWWVFSLPYIHQMILQFVCSARL